MRRLSAFLVWVSGTVTELFANPSSWYLGAAAAHLVLGIYVQLDPGATLLRTHFLAVAAAGIMWGVYFAAFAGDAEFRLDSWAFGIECVFMFAWFAALYRLLRGPYKQSMPETVRRGLYLFWAMVAVAGSLVAWFVYVGNGGVRAASYFHVIGLAIGLLCFALAAQLNRDAPVEDGIALHALAAACGLVMGAQVITLGVANLATAAPKSLMMLRALAAAGAAVLTIYATRRRPQWSLEIFVSPQARAYAPRLLAMLGVFLVLLALTPLYRSMGSSTAQPLAAALIGVTGVPIAILLFSENLSARLRVFVSKHFLPFRFDYREEWLRLIETLSSPEQLLPLPERSIKAVAQIVNAPAGVLWLRSSEDAPYQCVATWNTRIWPAAAVERDHPALQFMCERQWILDTAELDRDPELYEGLKRPEWLEELPDALLVVPLVSNEALLGFIVLFQSSSAFRLTFEEIDLLRTSGRQVAAHLAQYQADLQLAEAQQFEAFNRLTAFVMHDLKNLIAQQSLMVKNAARHKGNPAFFEDAIATIENSVARMNKMLGQLQSGDTSGPTERVSLAEALRDAARKTDDRNPRPEMDGIDDTLFANIDRDRFTAVIAHLIRNAQEATSPDGTVAIRLHKVDEMAMIVIQDDGCGMPADFIRNRLFRPFDSTKGSKGMGIGAYQARTFVTESGGTLDVHSEPNRGTRVSISIPVVD